jgi:transposase
MAIAVDPSDLTDGEWNLLAPLLPPAKPDGWPRTIDLRRLVNGLFYLVRAGCAWCYLPRDYGPWSTVYHYFSAISKRRDMGTGACSAAGTGPTAGGTGSHPQRSDHR